jgi:3-oxoacid CoA-transferase subunit A/glutaconate CoA-transferase subunit A
MSYGFVLENGIGKLAGWHDPDYMREWLRDNKSRDYTNKFLPLPDAVRKFVKDQNYIVFGGFGHVRTPMAAIYEIIRQKKRNLTMGAKTAVHDVDILVAAGVVDKIEATYTFGHELRGLSPASRRAVESGAVKVIAEWSNGGFGLRLKAAAMGLPFLPSRGALGSDTLKYSSSKVVKDPFSYKPISLIPACYPDVAFIHVNRSDIYGNSQIDGITVQDIDLARASKRLIITTEKIVSNDQIRMHPERTAIPYFLVDAVIKVPYGAHPTNMPYLYYSDEEIMAEWLKESKTNLGVEKYLKKYVYNVENFKQYLELVGGIQKMKKLKKIENLELLPDLKWLEA